MKIYIIVLIEDQGLYSIPKVKKNKLNKTNIKKFYIKKMEFNNISEYKNKAKVNKHGKLITFSKLRKLEKKEYKFNM